MDPNFDQNMDLNVPAGFGYDPTLQLTLEEMLAATPNPNPDFRIPAQTYDTRYDTLADYDMFIPDAPAYGQYPQEFPGPITPESRTHHTDQYDKVPYEGEVVTHDQVKEEETGETLLDWRSLINFNIPDYTQVSITDIPQIHALYTVYLATYESENEHATDELRMCYAKALSFALLTHYYPASQGFTVIPTSPGPIAKTGLSSILAAEDGSDIWKYMPDKSNKTKQRNRPLTLRELATAKEKERMAKYMHGVVGWACKLQWDWIKPDDIASFVVVRKIEVFNKETGLYESEWKPHTYLSILIDDFGQHPPRLSEANTTHRSDVLAEALCRGGRVQEGYGILFYGPRLEFYNFDAGEEWVWHEDEEDDPDKETQDVEPRMEVLECGGRGLEMDLRDMDLYGLNDAFSVVARRGVAYRDESGEACEGVAEEGGMESAW